MMYKDGCFAKHPRFRYFALNTEMRWLALQIGSIYVHQHPHDARLTVEELRDMVGHEGELFSSCVLHSETSLCGTRQYWFKQRSQLIAMVDTLSLPTVFITHSAADLQWPELARFISCTGQDSSTAHNTAKVENPAIVDWFFHYRIEKFISAFYVDTLGATDYWIRYEWQHCGSPHVHGLVWFPNAPDVEEILASTDLAMKDEFLKYVDKPIATINPAVLHDRSSAEDAPPPKTNPHICNQPYVNVEDFNQDLADLVATCQRHSRCSAAYCLHTHDGEQKCRFGFPKPLQPQTTFVIEDGQPVLYTERNDSLVNSYKSVQLAIENHLQDGQPATAISLLDHYIACPITTHVTHMTLLNFIQQCTMPKEEGANSSCKRKKVVVIVHPFCFPDHNGPNMKNTVNKS